MAHPARLTRRPRGRWLALVLAVLLVHLLAVDWVALQLQQDSLLPKMAAPMFTRLLQQAAPTVVVAAAPGPAAPSVVRPQVRAVSPPARSPARAASEPGRVAPAADAAPAAETAPTPAVADASEPITPPAPTASAAAPAPDASAPRAVASAPPPPAQPAASRAVAAAPAALAASAPALAADGWPADTRVNYQLGGNYRGALHGSARVQWLRRDQRYETRIDIDITLLASLTMTSQGTVTPQGLRPEVYEELRRSGARRAQLKDDAIVLGNGKVVPRPDRVQDTASQFVELAHRFATGEDQLEVGRSAALWLARPGGVDRWTYDIVGRDTLQTPQLGPIEAFHLKPRPIDQPRGNITAEIWFAPSLQYLPVRIRINMDGGETYLDLVVLTIQQR